jgi:dynactin 1
MEVGTRVVTKHGAGTIKFAGETKFASGDWMGVELDVNESGKNNGAVQGVQYFETSANRGLFVKPNQVQVENPKPKNPVRRSIIPPKPTGGLRAPTTRQSLSTRQSLAGTPGSKKSSAPGSGTSTPKTATTPKVSSSLSRQGSTLRSASPAPQISENETKSETEPENVNSQPSEAPRVIHIESGVSLTELQALKTQIKDWKSRCELIQSKRKTDFEKIRDAEKIRIKLEHVMAERERLTASVKKLNDEVDEKSKMLEQITDDHADVSDTIENAILEKEIAESKAEELEIELENLKDKFEEIETDYEILKAEVEEHGLEGAAGSFSNKSMEEENIKLKQTLVALKTSQNQEKMETNQIKTQLSQIQKDLSKKTEKIQLLQDENDANRRKIRDLTEQVDASADAHDIAERLTEKNFRRRRKKS